MRKLHICLDAAVAATAAILRRLRCKAYVLGGHFSRSRGGFFSCVAGTPAVKCCTQREFNFACRDSPVTR